MAAIYQTKRSWIALLEEILWGMPVSRSSQIENDMEILKHDMKYQPQWGILTWDAYNSTILYPVSVVVPAIVDGS